MAIIEMNCNRLVLILRLHECNGRLNSPDSFIVTFSHMMVTVVMDDRLSIMGRRL
jgi:hypothetical protein